MKEGLKMTYSKYTYENGTWYSNIYDKQTKKLLTTHTHERIFSNDILLQLSNFYELSPTQLINGILNSFVIIPQNKKIKLKYKNKLAYLDIDSQGKFTNLTMKGGV